MFKFFKKKPNDIPAPFNVLIFKEFGTKPFKDVDFSQYNVFQIHDFTLRNGDEQHDMFEKLVNIPTYFEVWTVPTILNINDTTLGLINEIKDNEDPQLKFYLDNLKELTKKMDNRTKIKNSYLVVNKENSERVKDEFKKLSFSLSQISFEEAQEIVVSI